MDKDDKYNPNKIEKKWQEVWEKKGVYNTPEIADKRQEPRAKRQDAEIGSQESGNKKYVLDMFPYPSGAGLHVGHIEGYTGTDVYSRYLRMKGFAVLHPMGWDAFGLPAENYAIKHGIPPEKSTHDNIKIFKGQIRTAGLSYDWSREIDSSSPDYYKWTQWLFILLFKHGLAYKKIAPANWCPSCETVLANEQVVDGKCERCDAPVVQKDLEQWFFKITDFADRLIEGLDHIDWPKSTKLMQKNWIGRKEGALIRFKIQEPRVRIQEARAKSYEDIEVFTTRPDTVFGVTFVAIAPEHKLAKQLALSNERLSQYINEVKKETDLQREHLNKEKTGVDTGVKAVNPANGEKVPIWVSDYVLSGTGTGAIMGVPAYDGRDYAFAKEFDLPIVKAGLTNRVFGKETRIYHLRDWLVSRQRYWGAPIPMIYCEKCDWQPVVEKDLPVVLPTDVDFKPTGESPIAHSPTFQKGVVCPKCGGPGKREVDTIDTFVDSSWYFLRFCDPKNKISPWNKEKVSSWLPVDVYVGGAEHTVLHLMYSRFIYKFLYDLGMVPKEKGDEPFLKLCHPGTVLGPDSRKMSKRWGNVINPDDVIKQYGADTLRMYEMFMGPFSGMKPWSVESVAGVHRFLTKIHTLYTFHSQKNLKANRVGKNLEVGINKLIKKVGVDIEDFSFNTAIAAMMEFGNELSAVSSQFTEKESDNSGSMTVGELWKKFLLVLAPFAPHLTEELWQDLVATNEFESIHNQFWPEFDKERLEQPVVTIPVMVNGKTRGVISVGVDVSQKEVENLVRGTEFGKKYLSGSQIFKIVYVPGKVVNFLLSS